MKTKENIWTKEEEALLILGYTTAELAEHPLMVARGRTRKNIRKKMWRDCIKLAKPPKPVKPARTAKPHVMKCRPYTEEQKALLLSYQYTNQELADMPLFQDRTMQGIRSYRLKARKVILEIPQEPPKVRIRVKPQEQPRQLYQFISTADATPARKKVWAKEERAMQTV